MNKRFVNKWGFIELYNICSDYLNNQTEENAIILIEKIKQFEKDYPIIEIPLH